MEDIREIIFNPRDQRHVQVSERYRCRCKKDLCRCGLGNSQMCLKISNSLCLIENERVRYRLEKILNLYTQEGGILSTDRLIIDLYNRNKQIFKELSEKDIEIYLIMKSFIEIYDEYTYQESDEFENKFFRRMPEGDLYEHVKSLLFRLILFYECVEVKENEKNCLKEWIEILKFKIEKLKEVSIIWKEIYSFY